MQGPPSGRPRVSVVMATYDGAAYVVEQLTSILAELGPHDEVLVADDVSRDTTVDLVRAVADPRVLVLPGEVNRGHVATFARALARATGDVVLLADQDDVWPAGRVDLLVAGLRDAGVAAGNITTFGTHAVPPRRRLVPVGPGSPLLWRTRNLVGQLLGRRPYLGSAMAVRREVLSLALPIPAYVESHDVWLAMIGNTVAGMAHVPQSVLAHRVHGANVSTPRRRSLPVVAVSRLAMLRALVEIGRRAAAQRAGRRPGESDRRIRR